MTTKEPLDFRRNRLVEYITDRGNDVIERSEKEGSIMFVISSVPHTNEP